MAAIFLQRFGGARRHAQVLLSLVSDFEHFTIIKSLPQRDGELAAMLEPCAKRGDFASHQFEFPGQAQHESRAARMAELADALV